MTASSLIHAEGKLPPSALGLTTLNFSNTQVRIILEDGTPWFHAGDVCTVLDYGNPRQAMTRLDVEEKGVRSMDTPGGTQQVNFINESGLYTLIMGSRKPEAKAFKRWVTAEVLPAIRKTGSFSVKRTPLTLKELFEAQYELGPEPERKLEVLLHQQAIVDATLKHFSRLVRPTPYSQRDLKFGEEYLYINDLAKLLGTGAVRLRRFLREHGVLGNQAETCNRPTETYYGMGFFWTRSSFLFFTPLGRKWLFDMACQGWLDSILDRDALLARISAPQGLPLPGQVIDPKRP
jgi:anti-repressor protein